LKFDDESDGKEDGQEHPGRMVGRRFPLPQDPSLSEPLGIFTLGDMRLQAWIFDSGIQLNGMPSDHLMLVTPLPNHHYPPGYSVGQAVASANMVRSTHLNIPVDFDLRKIPQGQDFVQIDRGTPMVQYLPVRAPRVSLRAEG
jgi:hypothetical protein